MTTEAQVQRWAAQWGRGWSHRRIAEQAGVDESTVRRALAGRVTPRPPGPQARPKPTAAVVMRTYQQLRSIRATVRELGVSETYVRARLHAAGLIEHHPDQRPRKSGS